MYRAWMLCVAFSLALAGIARAQDPAEEVTRMLEQQGFSIVEVERTLLGRIMIQAENERETREVVIDRSTGEILRDYTEEKNGGSSALPPSEPPRNSLAAIAMAARPALTEAGPARLRAAGRLPSARPHRA